MKIFVSTDPPPALVNLKHLTSAGADTTIPFLTPAGGGWKPRLYPRQG